MAKFCSNCGKSIQPSDKFCNSCGSNILQKTENNSIGFANKRQKVLGTDKKSVTVKSGFLIIAAVILFGLLVFWQSLPDKTNPVLENQPKVSSPVKYSGGNLQMASIPVKTENGKIVIPFELVKQKKFVTFSYQSPSGNIPLLAYISGEGKLVTAISMCEPCNSTRFHISGSILVCNSCGTTWELDNLIAISGACGKYPPDAIPSKIVAGNIYIDESIVARWQRRI
ncbi:MAG: Fe-S-containing protein [Calditrichia bacterium]